jgi:hypothetical protein
MFFKKKKKKIQITPFTYGQYSRNPKKVFFSLFYPNTRVSWFNVPLNKSFLLIYLCKK